MNNLGTVTIQHGKEKPIQNQHPWIYSGAISKLTDDCQPGDIVTVVDSKGRFLGRGYYNPTSQIRVRMLTWQDETINEEWWYDQLSRAVHSRMVYQDEFDAGVNNAVRLVNAENDFLPGLVVDRYGEWLVLQSLTLGMDHHKEVLSNLLAEMLKPRGIYERSDVDIRRKEGLKDQTGLLWGEEPPSMIEIEENTLIFSVDVRNGHKTGFYLDQRENRGWLHDLLYLDGDDLHEDKRRVLNMFSYTGGFGLYALAAGVKQVVNVDSSQAVLKVAKDSIKRNELPLENAQFVAGDAFQVLRDYVTQGEQFDAVVLDPPKFAQSTKDVEGATRGYKDLNLQSFKLIRSGGYLMTFSCSGAISQDLFQKVVFGALADSGRQAQIIRHLSGSEDHPVALTFPEGAYLKGLLCRVW
jgi:23S rRNA (cytosine1962-C5)-methyltransferase